MSISPSGKRPMCALATGTSSSRLIPSASSRCAVPEIRTMRSFMVATSESLSLSLGPCAARLDRPCRDADPDFAGRDLGTARDHGAGAGGRPLAHLAGRDEDRAAADEGAV